MLPGMASWKFDEGYKMSSNLILAYLERGACLSCHIDDKGVLNHCEKCAALFQAALNEVKKEAKPEPLKPLSYEERKKLEAERFMEVGFMRKSHQWAGSQAFVDPGRTRMAPYASHCKACGLSMALFKVKPEWCSKAPKK